MERQIGVSLRRLSNLICRHIEQMNGRLQMEGITGTNGWIIGYISHQNDMGNVVFQRDLETRFGITRSTASKVVGLMAQKGLIEQQSVPEDRRLKKLVLTERAQQYAQQMNDDRIRVEQALRSGLNDQEIGQLFALLDRLQENIQTMDKAEGGTTT